MQLHGFGVQYTPLVVVRKGGMDPNGYGASSTYTVGNGVARYGDNGERLERKWMNDKKCD